MATKKKTTSAKKVTAKKPAAKKPPARSKPVAKKAAKPLAKKSAVKKAAVKKTPAKKATAPRPVTAKRPAGIPEQMRDAALRVLDERQAEDIVTLDLHGRSTVADYLIVASGRASRQIAAIAHYLQEAFEKLGVKQVRLEGMTEGNWVLVDAGDVIVHLFRPEVRTYYNIETIWADRSKK